MNDATTTMPQPDAAATLADDQVTVTSAVADDPDEYIVAIPADVDDPEDFDVSVAGLKRAHLARALRLLRRDLGLTTEAFAARYGIPAADYAGYESGYVRPPKVVSAYLRVIVAEPERVAEAVG